MWPFRKKPISISKSTAKALQVTNFNKRKMDVFANSLLKANNGDYVIMPDDIRIFQVSSDSDQQLTVKVGTVLTDTKE